MAEFPNQSQQSQPSRQLPSDLRHKIARMYVDDREFNDDNGRSVKYSRLVTEFEVAGQVVKFEARLGKNDKALLAIAEDFSANRAF